ncbi:hypothetical protein [Anaeromassilibacillus sp. SJQ-1]|uniref:hypothetical protein n=1 Tax=Anaeromassilibacillus sp. SJQ-1 TaxID=3375419 RepID=UPI003988DA1C
MSTENIAYEKRYWDWRAQYDTMFAPENRFPPARRESGLYLSGARKTRKRFTINAQTHTSMEVVLVNIGWLQLNE